MSNVSSPDADTVDGLDAAELRTGFDYVQGSYPSGATEGDELYHTGDDAAYVYDGSTWIDQTVASHDELGGISATDHLSPGTGLSLSGDTLDLALSREDGTHTVSGNGGTFDVSFANAYLSDLYLFAIDSESSDSGTTEVASATPQSWTTDGSGNVTGATIGWQSSYDASYSLYWRILGVTAP